MFLEGCNVTGGHGHRRLGLGRGLGVGVLDFIGEVAGVVESGLEVSELAGGGEGLLFTSDLRWQLKILFQQLVLAPLSIL